MCLFWCNREFQVISYYTKKLLTEYIIREYHMLNSFSRTELLLGRDAMERLSKARVAIFGIGGVGGYAVEALARSGVGTLDLIDDDQGLLNQHQPPDHRNHLHHRKVQG